MTDNGDMVQLALMIFVVVTLAVACLMVMFAVWNRTAPKASLARTDAAVAEIDNRLHAVEAQVESLKTEVAHLPSKDALHALDRALLQLTSTVERLGERIDGSVRGVERIEQYLLNQPGPIPQGERKSA